MLTSTAFGPMGHSISQTMKVIRRNHTVKFHPEHVTAKQLAEWFGSVPPDLKCVDVDQRDCGFLVFTFEEETCSTT